jgi:crotonobetainyl-CoA:carnitine CoA-transferase CaiB-like acyl-CoA transferase
MSAESNIFSGLKVVDFASFIAGPAAATILSDFGAEVVKVEPPGAGDPYRYLTQIPPNPVSEVNYAWQLTNRNKRSLALNLKAPEAKDIVERLVRWADVVIVNFPPRVKAGLGLNYEALAPLNPRLIYADITGYGSRGPEAESPGFDITAYWARSGLMEVTHDAGSPPTLPIPGIGDHATATTLYAAIVTGLLAREKTGKGTHVSTSLVANGIWAAGVWVEGALNGARFFPQHDRKTPPNALLNPYQTLDNRWVVIIATQPREWDGFIRAVGLPQLAADPNFDDPHKRLQNSAALVEILDPVFASQPLAYWKHVLSAGRVIFGVVQNAKDIISDPQLEANEIVVPLEGAADPKQRTVSSPIEIVGFPKVAPSLAPQVGEHSYEVLKSLDFSAEAIARLQETGAVGGDTR